MRVMTHLCHRPHVAGSLRNVTGTSWCLASGLVGCLLAGWSGVASGADEFVTLDNRQRISGVVDETPDATGKVSIKTSHGVIRISKALIVDEDLSFEGRRAKIKPDDRQGLVDLGRWCRAKGMNKQALELLETASKLPGFELPDRVLYIRLVDEQRSPEEAMPLYLNYRERGGKDPDTLARLAVLEKAKAEFDNQNQDGTILTGPTTGVPQQPNVTSGETPTLPTGPAYNMNLGLELKNWEAEAAQYSNPITTKVVFIMTATGPNKMREIAFTGGKMTKAALRCSMNLTITDKSVLTFWAQNTGTHPASIAIAVKTGEQWEFHESPQKELKPGDFQKMSYDLKGSDFKSLATNWMGNGKIANLDDVKELQIIIYNRTVDGSILIYNMGFPSKPEL